MSGPLSTVSSISTVPHSSFWPNSPRLKVITRRRQLLERKRKRPAHRAGCPAWPGRLVACFLLSSTLIFNAFQRSFLGFSYFKENWQIDRMEKEVSKAVATPRFIVAPLTFVPLGALDKKESFNLYDRLTENQFAVIYRCWRWIVKKVRRDSLHLFNQPLPIRSLIYLISNFGGKVKKRGFDLKKALNPP